MGGAENQVKFQPCPLSFKKFGGTSVATIERIKAVADIVIATRKQGHQVVVVLSAMAGETDRLTELAGQVAKNPDSRELDVLLSTGELVTIALLTMVLQERKYSAVSYTGGQVHILTDNVHNKARIVDIESARVKKDLADHKIVVIAGFQGIDENGNITTLGRGGTDTTAVAMAVALNADECRIYTDVDGVYTADPRIVPEAKRMDNIALRGDAGTGQPGCESAADTRGGIRQ